ncbi:helix-turn-helix domain-containing protein [Thermomicrobium sp. CFH 73360]|uniref:ArsR/SmtB family transcription factor n=1 Tax=Thermomicrobium sp. CFH 73360 TaxID=2951987 RepID=UPI00207782F2|nr:helix-turn-helix domain-containing protein [Thermomicrobium sp. CFH 73360]MCM8747403.1 helix-turn-helix domain-containing protein [Thermomicrobium sp. CFH 73360]
MAAHEANEAEPFEPADVHVIADLGTLRACLHPLRLAILECLQREALNVAQIGYRLGLRSTTLYYHVRELEKAGLIRLVRTAIESGIQTKYYRAAARFYRLAPTLLQPQDGPEQLDASVDLVTTTLDMTVGELQAALLEGTFTAHPEISLVQRWITRTTAERAQRFKQRLLELLTEFQALEDESGDIVLEFTPVLFPRARRSALSVLGQRRARRGRARGQRRPDDGAERSQASE